MDPCLSCWQNARKVKRSVVPAVNPAPWFMSEEDVVSGTVIAWTGVSGLTSRFDGWIAIIAMRA